MYFSIYRYAKRKLDDYSFFGGNLHVCYAPEYESVNETRQKLQERRREIATRLKKLSTYTEMHRHTHSPRTYARRP